ncbi:MAG: hypothetical protein ACYDH8_09270 [Syntrophales bacterium]
MLETDDLSILTDKELAKWHAEARGAAPQYEILAENEWRMRALRVQRDFNEAIVKKQMRLTKFSIVFGLVGIIIGVVLTFLFPRLLPVDKRVSPSISSEQSFLSTTVTTGKATAKQANPKGIVPLETTGKDGQTSSQPPISKKHE